jgi:cell division protein ZapA
VAECRVEAPTEAVRVRLFGREYSIKGQGDSRYIQELADFIEERADEIRNKSAVVSTLDLTILTLLNIADEMFRYKQVTNETIKQLEEKADRLVLATDREA